MLLLEPRRLGACLILRLGIVIVVITRILIKMVITAIATVE